MKNNNLYTMIKNARVAIVQGCIGLSLLSISHCTKVTDPTAGTSSGVETKVARGIMVNDQGNAASNTTVYLVPVDYDPCKSKVSLDSLADVTDVTGHYEIHVNDTGWYNVFAIKNNANTRALIRDIHIDKDSTTVQTGYLGVPGSISVESLDATAGAFGYVYIPGTPIYAYVNTKGSAFLQGIPGGVVPVLYYNATTSNSQKAVRYSITVASGDTATIEKPFWQYSQKIIMNTSSSGVPITENLSGFPVLIRLTKSNFRFQEAGITGNDLRFTKADTIAVPFEIERWDPQAGAAEIWVKVDTIYGNNDSQYIRMYWGNPLATSNANSALVFDTANGFQGVWHMSQPGNTTIFDATVNNYFGTPYNMTASSGVAGIIGGAVEFDGVASYIAMPNTAQSKLNYNANGFYSVSAWVYTDTLNGKYHMIASKGNFQYNLEIKNSNEWEFTEFHDTTGWDESLGKAQVHTWEYVVGIRAGDKQYLYVNGVPMDDTIITNSTGGATSMYRSLTNNFMLGKRNDTTSFYFDGKMDEVRVHNKVLSADWIMLCYMNQKIQDAFVKFE